MSTINTKHDAVRLQPSSTPDEIDARDRLKDADELVAVFANMSGTQQFTPAADALYTAGMSLIESENPTDQRMGYVLGLDALIASPGILDKVVRDLRQALVDADPALAILGGAPAPSGARRGPTMHEIDGVGCVLDSDGTLQVERSGSPVVTFAPKEVYALLTFLRLPGVAETIERADADQQAEDFERIEEEEREEEAKELTREQAYEYLHNDQDIQQRIVTEAIRAFRERITQRKMA